MDAVPHLAESAPHLELLFTRGIEEVLVDAHAEQHAQGFLIAHDIDPESYR
ncbi:hypothetical protein D3C80_2173560 [compost metagenome]